MPTSTVENYLKAILGLSEDSGQTRRVAPGEIAERLGVTPGTVTTMMKHLSDKGWVSYESRRGVKLTAKGRKHASQVLRRHRLIERFLVDIVGLGWAEVHEEAEVLEHAVSDRLLDRIDEMLGYPERDPHGDPIPSADGAIATQALTPLSECHPGRFTVVQILGDEPAFLDWLDQQKLRPGRHIRVESRDDFAQTLTISAEDGSHKQAIGTSTASRLLVQPES